jgi:hypothetical protein
MKCVKVENYVVEAGTHRPSPSWGGGCLLVAVTVVDANDRCSGQGKCTVRRGGGGGKFNTGCRCEAIVLFLFLAVSSFSLCRRGFQVLLKIRPSCLLMMCGASQAQWLL